MTEKEEIGELFVNKKKGGKRVESKDTVAPPSTSDSEEIQISGDSEDDTENIDTWWLSFVETQTLILDEQILKPLNINVLGSRRKC